MDLAELMSDVDITDPASMEKLLIYLDELQSQDDDFMESLVDKLTDASITWLQPWYQEAQSLTRPIKVHDIERNESETYRVDNLSRKEKHILKKNWKKFREMFNVPDKPESFARWRNRTKSRNPNKSYEKARHFLTAFLAQGLERTLNQVYKRFVSLYAAPNRGPFSEIEEKTISICAYHQPGKVVPYCAAILGREPRGIYKKLHILNNGKPEAKRIKWRLPVASKLVQSMMQHSGLPLEKLKNTKFETSMWLKVQEDMDHDYHYLQRFWYTCLHVQLFVKYRVKLKPLKRKILKRLKKSYNVWTDIQWRQLVAKFPDGFTHGFLYGAIHKYVRKYSGNYRTDPLSDVCGVALESVDKRGKEKCLRTLVLDEEGNLNAIKYDEELPL